MSEPYIGSGRQCGKTNLLRAHWDAQFLEFLKHKLQTQPRSAIEPVEIQRLLDIVENS